MSSANPAATASLPNANPAFLTEEGARAWLDAQPLASTVQMQSQLQRQLRLLNHHVLPANERFAILEALRGQIYRTQHECQTRFARRPIPLAPPEQAAFDAAQTTWRTLADGYIRCLESLLTGEMAVRDKAALIVERILATLVSLQIDVYHSSGVPTPDYWHQLHQCIEVAEQLEIVDEPVKDRLHNAEAPVSIAAVYAEAFLLHSAGLNELGQRHAAWVLRWARRWSNRVALRKPVPEPNGPAVPFYVALDGKEPACHTMPAQGSIRMLDTTELRRSLKKRLAGLTGGKRPADLQLGDDCVQPSTEQLLNTIYQRWCKETPSRRHDRHARKGSVMLHSGIGEAHRVFLAGRAFQLPGVVDMGKLRREREQMMSSLVEPLEPDAPRFPSDGETWQLVDESASGMRLVRSAGKSRIAVGMLVTLQIPNVRQPMLASVHWCMVNNEGRLEMGVQMIPGLAEAHAIGGKPHDAKTVAWERVLLLPAVPALKETSTLLLPNGWFEPGLVLELHENGKTHNVRLGQPLERGRDFDRVTFSDA